LPDELTCDRHSVSKKDRAACWSLGGPVGIVSLLPVPA